MTRKLMITALLFSQVCSSIFAMEQHQQKFDQYVEQNKDVVLAIRRGEAAKAIELLKAKEDKNIIRVLSLSNPQTEDPIYAILLPRVGQAKQDWFQACYVRLKLTTGLLAMGIAKEVLLPNITGYDARAGEVLIGAGIMAGVDFWFNYKELVRHYYEYKPFFVSAQRKLLDDYFNSEEVSGIIEDLKKQNKSNSLKKR